MRTLILALALPAFVPDAFAQERELYAESPAVWFEAHRVMASISADGRLAALPIRWPESIRVIDLRNGADVAGTLLSGVDSIRAVVFTHRGQPVMRGWRMGSWGWYTREDGDIRRLAIPHDADPRWSNDGAIAYVRRVPWFGRTLPDSVVFASTSEGWRAFPLAGRVTGVAFLPGDTALIALSSNARGASILYRVNLRSGHVEVVAGDLDADPVWSPIAVDATGRRAYIALASLTAARPEERHRAAADRNLDIYEIDLGSGARRAVIDSPAEEHAPAVVGDQLYWTRTESEMSVAVVPTTGGSLREVVRGAMLPSWRPDGRAMGFTYGAFRGADWVLNWEGAVVEVDTMGNAARPMQPMITGLHEDFSPVWSPNGRWIAYHSHRSTKPVVLYADSGTTDDVWLRAADGARAEEIRVTSGEREVGPPDWSRDGTRLIFTALLPGGGRGHSYAGIVTIDTLTGRAKGQTRLPLGPIPGAENAAWSPVSDDIVIQSVEAPGRHAIWTVRADGSRPRRLVGTASHTYSGVDWSADGMSIFYSAIVDGRMQLFAVPARGGTPRQLTRDDWNVVHPSVSPDGRLVAATRIRNRKAILSRTIDTISPGHERELRAIDAARRRFEAGIRDNDGTSVSVYAPDMFYFPPGREPIAGRDAIRTPSERPARDWEIAHVVHEVDVRGDLAYEIGRWIQRRKTDRTAIGGGGYLWIWKRQPDGQWAIWREVWNDGPPVQRDE